MSLANKGIPIVVSAPSGCGKDTILEQLFKINDNLAYSVSATTRAMREGEIDGISYHFHTRESFEKMIADSEVLEYTEYCGNYYGTPKKAVLDMLEQGKDVILKIEVEGAMNIKKIFPECVMIFILPPSINELERRLRKRGTETEETINARISQARNELLYADKFDYLVVNGDLDKAVGDVNTVILSEKMAAARNTQLLEDIKNS